MITVLCTEGVILGKYSIYIILYSSSVAAVVSCYCFIIVTAVIVLGLGTWYLLLVLLYPLLNFANQQNIKDAVVLGWSRQKYQLG